jgi:hypothetical protein
MTHLRQKPSDKQYRRGWYEIIQWHKLEIYMYIIIKKPVREAKARIGVVVPLKEEEGTYVYIVRLSKRLFSKSVTKNSSSP